MADAKGFEFFYEILTSFRDAGKSAQNADDLATMEVEPFLKAMTLFLRVFDAFGNPFFVNVVKSDINGNIKKLDTASSKRSTKTLRETLDAELADAKLATQIKKEKGAGVDSATCALLWMKRMMQFVVGMIKNMLDDPSMTMLAAARDSYGKTLRLCHNFITRTLFDKGLLLVPARETFFKNLASGAPIENVENAMKEYIVIFEPMLLAIDADFKKRELEPLIK